MQLALMNEILGRSAFAPSVFGCQAPDSGNAEILAHYGTASQRERYLAPLLDGRISSCYAMGQGGADPSLFTTRAVRDGEHWVIDGEEWFSSSFEKAAFIIVMAVTNPDVSVYWRSRGRPAPQDDGSSTSCGVKEIERGSMTWGRIAFRTTFSITSSGVIFK
ncbi:hypothetical protein FAGKG844_240030 [Frankia sp. AgKG'84/4]